MSNSEYVLEAVNLTKTFPGVKALDQVSARVRPGTVHALMGENGAGNLHDGNVFMESIPRMREVFP